MQTDLTEVAKVKSDTYGFARNPVSNEVEDADEADIEIDENDQGPKALLEQSLIMNDGTN